nr:MarR family transcriptional regulator [uncultured Holophaga sp.]
MRLMGLLKWVSWAMDASLAPVYDGAPLSQAELEMILPLRFAASPTIARRLADHLRVSPAAISKTLARLEKRGLIQRRPSPSNRRAALIHLTEAGRNAIDEVFPRQLAREAELLSRLQTDREALAQGLECLLEALERGRD